MRSLFRRSMTVAALITALSGSQFAQAAPVVTGTPVDTLTTLNISWSWDMAGGTSATYQGTFWEASIAATFANSDWTVVTTYKHLGGPHGEGAETFSHTHTFGPTIGTLSGSGTDDHEDDQHLLAHPWSISGDLSMGNGGNATLHVAHVPEPQAWALMLAGMGVVGGFSASRKRRH